MNVVLRSMGMISREIHLRRQESVTVGSTYQADFRVVGPQMAPVHFLVVASDDRCRIEHVAGEDWKTSLNGQEIEKSHLANGDTIEIGRTRFQVLINGVEQITPMTFGLGSLGDGTTVVEPTTDKFAPQRVVQDLSTYFFLHGVINLASLGWNATQRFPELARAHQVAQNLVLLPMASPERAQEWLANAANMDAISMVLGLPENSATVNQVVSSNHQSFWRPSILAAHLATPTICQNILPLVGGILVLADDTPGGWRLYTCMSSDEISSILSKS